MPSLAEAEQQGVALADKLKAPSPPSLRDRGGDAIVAADTASRLNVDGYVLPKSQAEAYRAGDPARVPALIGSNSDEGTVYPSYSAAAFAADARKRYGARAEGLLALYPASTDAEARALSYELHRDRLFASAVRSWAGDQSRVAPVFVYHFSHHPPFAAGLAYQQQTPASAPIMVWRWPMPMACSTR